MLSARDGEKNRRELLANMPKYVNGNISNDFLSSLLFFFGLAEHSPSLASFIYFFVYSFFRSLSLLHAAHCSWFLVHDRAHIKRQSAQ